MKRSAHEVWNTADRARLEHFASLVAADEAGLPPHRRADREFVIGETRLIRELAAQAGTVIEFGSGIGRSLLPGAREFPTTRFLGLDSAPEPVRLMALLAEEEGLANLRGLLADVRRVPLRDSSVDRVLIPYQTFGIFLGRVRDRSLVEARRILRPGGALYIGGFANLDLAADCYPAWGLTPSRIDPETRLVHLDGFDSLWATEDQVLVHAERAGFALVHRQDCELGFSLVLGPR
ncbi:class I SAM-dependent methyltransferase [Actinomadura monticuli]|uniref:Class I SAM-dependent methyltransferase n=1 Tax=Actinomadura monticuli TaxID=3097367 RepID=A0ABV4Q4V0_9ACTN